MKETEQKRKKQRELIMRISLIIVVQENHNEGNGIASHGLSYFGALWLR